MVQAVVCEGYLVLALTTQSQEVACGDKNDHAISLLRKRFPFRKWRTGQGEYLGRFYTQHLESEISDQQQEYAQHTRPIAISKDRVQKPWLPATEKEVAALRAVNGALGWISSDWTWRYRPRRLNKPFQIRQCSICCQPIKL